MKHLFGPVPSRRLVLSLGVDIVPMKTCTLSCRYCQVGKTHEPTLERREYIPVQTILEEINERVESGLETDWITFSGSGEPTLNSGIGKIIVGIKELTDVPVCVITNGTLLSDPQVRNDLLAADAVMPSLDSAVDETFRAICRPHPDLKASGIIDGLIHFRAEYSGKIWLEILLIDGMNDTQEELSALKDAVRRISPDAVQLNTVVRPPAELSAKPLSRERLEEIRDYFGDKTEIIAAFDKSASLQDSQGIEDVRAYLKRRPGSSDDISAALGIALLETEKYLKLLYNNGEIKRSEFSDGQFWEYITIKQ
ncbi:radical SAM protein [Candidatus Omnitrophota bacterium]